MFGVALVAHKYSKTKAGTGVTELPTIKQRVAPMQQWDGSLGDLVHNEYDRPLSEISSPQHFTCTACGEEAWTGMTICAYGCRGVFLYHPAEIELEVPIEEVPVIGFNTAGAADHENFLPDPNFAYQPGGRRLELPDAAALGKYISSLVRSLREIVIYQDYEPGRDDGDMRAMREMIKKECQHRLKWCAEDPTYRLARAAKGQLPNWSGNILGGPWVPESASDVPPLHLMPAVFPKEDREGKFELINFVHRRVVEGTETLKDKWTKHTWKRMLGNC